jgi:hypothetical protein
LTAGTNTLVAGAVPQSVGVGIVACTAKVPVFVTAMVVLEKATVPLTTQGDVHCVTQIEALLMATVPLTTHGDVPCVTGSDDSVNVTVSGLTT